MTELTETTNDMIKLIDDRNRRSYKRKKMTELTEMEGIKVVKTLVKRDKMKEKNDRQK